MGLTFREFKQHGTIFFFVFKVCHGIFDEITDIIYFSDQRFLYKEIQESMFFFLILSPLIQIIAWTLLLTKIKVNQLTPMSKDRIKQSKSISMLIYNSIISYASYYAPIFLLMIKQIPQSILISLLQEIKVFPFFLFGYTYYEYKAIITRDLMKNLAPHLKYFQKLEEDEETHRRKQSQRMSNLHIPIRGQSFGATPKIDKNTPNDNLKNNNNELANMTPRNIQNLRRSENLSSRVNIEGSGVNLGSKNVEMFDMSIELPQRSKILSHFANRPTPNDIPIFPLDLSETHDQQAIFLMVERQEFLILFAFELRIGNSQYFDKVSTPTITKDIELRIKTTQSQEQSLFKRTVQKIISQNRLKQKERDKTLEPLLQQVSAPVKKKQKDHEDIPNDIFSQIDLILDANISPTLNILLQDQNLRQFILITDVIEAAFEALPMAVLQYINNGINSSWFHEDGSPNYFLLFSFFASLITITLHSVSLLIILYDENIETFYNTLTFLSKIKQRQKDHDEESSSNIKVKDNTGIGFSKIIQMTPKIRIFNQIQLQKLQYLRKEVTCKVVDLTFALKPDRSEAPYTITFISKLVPIFKNLSRIEIEFNENQLKQSINPALQSILTAHPNLSRGIFHFYGNHIRHDDQDEIYSTISEWMLSKEGRVDEFAFLSDQIFYWRCPQVNKLYSHKDKIIAKRFENIIASTNNNKRIIEITLSDKILLLNEIEEFSMAVKNWKNLMHFQLICKRLPIYCEDLIVKALDSTENLQSSFIASQNKGIIFNKGFKLLCPLHQNSCNTQRSPILSSSFTSSLKLSLQDTQFEQIVSFSLTGDLFQFNYDAVNFVFKEQLFTSDSILIETILIDLQYKNKISRQFLAKSIQAILEHLPIMKNATSLNIQLSSNELQSNICYSLGNAIGQLRKLSSLTVDLSKNQIKSDGMEVLIQPLIMAQKKLSMLNLNLNNNRVENEGLKNIISFLKKQGFQENEVIQKNIDNSLRININYFSRAELGRQIQFGGEVSDKFIGRLSNLTLDLSNTRLKLGVLNELINAISLLTQLEELKLIARGNLIRFSQSPTTFKSLPNLKNLSLDFWCNDFSNESLNNLFGFIKHACQVEYLSIQLVNNNVRDNQIPNFVGFLSSYQSLKELKLNFAENGNDFSNIPELYTVISSNSKLKVIELNLEACNVNLSEIKEMVLSIELLWELESLKLNFSSNPSFNDECCSAILDNISKLYMLREINLNFSKTQITDASVKLISKRIIKLNSLKSASINFHTNFTTKESLNEIVSSFIQCPWIQFPFFNV